jgi:phosphatidylglycerophosphatase A
MKHLAFFVVTGFYTGLLPAALMRRMFPYLPERRGLGGGFMGSLMGLAIQLLLASDPHALGLQIALIVLTFLLGLWLVEPAEKLMFERWGYRKRHDGSTANVDYNATCLDEIHGQLIAGLAVFAAGPEHWLKCLVYSFVVFRLFDAGKLWPAGLVERRFKNAFGIMFDDTVAGLMAAMLTWWAYNLH